MTAGVRADCRFSVHRGGGDFGDGLGRPAAPWRSDSFRPGGAGPTAPLRRRRSIDAGHAAAPRTTVSGPPGGAYGRLAWRRPTEVPPQLRLPPDNHRAPLACRRAKMELIAAEIRLIAATERL